MSERDIFIAALQYDDPAGRTAYLDQVCTGQPDLRRQVDELLGLYAGAGSFLLQSPIPCANDASPQGLKSESQAEGPGCVIGPYKLLEQIGEGGFGVVFLAEQTDPVRRKVALKVLKPGMDTRQVVARFEAERQALAIMDHPNIARIFDGGATSTGRPYFVMELVKGISITEFCDQHHLTPRQRLELFLPVCQAVQHAHTKGIIHRDLKPSNVIVTRHDTRAVVKVIDFGVAKALGQELTDKTLFTGLVQMVGTPLYMSPEQAGMSDLDVDTRSDIYSLGVLLYELLTGTTPFTRERFQSAAYDEIRRIIREEEPPKPSTRLSESTDKLPSISAQRQTEPAKLTRLLRGELDWIVMKSLEKDRVRRYETVNGFAADIQRYLADEPVHACPPSAAYRLRKMVRRNKAVLAMTCVIAAALLATVGSIGWAARDRTARRGALEHEAVGALEETRRWYDAGRLAEAQAAVSRAAGLLASEPGASDLLLEQIKRWKTDLNMVARLDEIRLRPSALSADLGHFDLSRLDPSYKEAFQNYELDVDDPSLDTGEASRRIFASPIKHHLVAALDDWVAARRLLSQGGYHRLVDIARQADPDPWRDRLRNAVNLGDPAALVALAKDDRAATQPPATVNLLQVLLRSSGQSALANDVLRRAQRHHSADFWLNQQLAWHLETQRSSGDTEAIGFYRASVAARPDSAGARQNLGVALRDAGDFEGAEAEFREAIRLAPDYYHAYGELGFLLARRGERDQAVKIALQGVRVVAQHPARIRGDAQTNLARTLLTLGDLDGAEAAGKEAVRLHPTAAWTHYYLGLTLYAKRSTPAAADAYRNAIALDPNLAQARTNLGLILIEKGQLDEGIEQYRQAIGRAPRFAEVHKALSNLGQALELKGMRDEAVAAYREAVRSSPVPAEAEHAQRRFRVLHPPGSLLSLRTAREQARLRPNSIEYHRELGEVLLGEGKPDEADAAFAQVVRLAPHDPLVHCAIVDILTMHGRWSRAAALLRRILELRTDDFDRWYQLVTLDLVTDDRESYRSDCRRMFEQANKGPNSPVVADRVARACALAPGAVDDFGRIEALADRAVTGTEQHQFFRYFAHSKGLVCYRAGRCDAALDWLERFGPNADGTHFDALAFATAALAHYRLGKSQQAEEALAKAKAILNGKMPDPAKGRLFGDKSWPDWLQATILCREAEGLLGNKPR